MRVRDVSVAVVVGLCASCGADGRTKSAPIELHIVAPKGVLDSAESVALSLYQGGSCKGPDYGGGGISMGDPHQLAKGCGGGTQWCVSLQLPIDPATPITFYVEGQQSGKASFRGCANQAVNQDPLAVKILVQRIVPGSKCGDGIVGPTETCDPAGASDEACDATKCQTNEVVLSNGPAASQFYNGLAQRKTSLAALWLPDGKYFGIWSDAVTAFAGGDGLPEITWRRMTSTLVSETTPILLQQELRLGVAGTPVSGTGSKKRNGPSSSPSINPLPSGELLVVFSRQPSGEVSRVFGVVVPSNMGAPSAADFTFATSSIAQTGAQSAASSSGDVLAAWIENTTVKSALRKVSGTIGAAAALSSSGTPSGVRVAWIGGDYVVVWSDGDDIKMRSVGADGTPKGAEAVVNATHKAGKQEAPWIAALPSGEFAVVWQSTGGDGDTGADIRAQRFDKSLNAVGKEVDTPLNETNKNGDQITPSIAAGAVGSGGFYWVAWEDAARSTISGRILNAAGGFLYNNVDGQLGEFDVTLAPRGVSSPAVVVGGATPGFVAVSFADDSDMDPAADDTRVKVRRFPLPPPP